MKRFLLPILIGTMLFTGKAKADEGMWLLPLLEKLNYAEMKEMGLELTPEQIYSINNSSLKDAIVIFGRGCTGEIISDQGLLLTNHHCGYGQIQSHTTLEHDVLGEGFWAKSFEDELPNEGLTVTFLVSVDIVTDKVLEGVTDEMSEEARKEQIEKNSKALEEAASEGNDYRVQVRSFFDNNQYLIFVYETYKDVRLVGTPPESIGKYGHDTDNWMWPRHTGDFSMFRVYSGPDGKPAEYSKENIPLKPKHHLPVSLRGVEKGDFAMILGYPGGTDRYISSWGVEELMDVEHPNRIRIRGDRQEVLMQDMMADKEIYNQYASKYARSSNYWKYSIGQSKGIARLKVIERKKEEEEAFTKWVEEDAERKARYGEVLSDIESYYKSRKDAYNNLQILGETFSSTEAIWMARYVSKLESLLLDDDATEEAIKEEAENVKGRLDGLFKDYSRSTDIKVTKQMLKTYADMVSAAQRADFFTTIDGKYKGNIDKYVDVLFEKSIFDEKATFEAFLADPSAKVLAKDPAFAVFKSLRAKQGEFYAKYSEGADKFGKARRLYTEGMLKMNEDRRYYPDANFTMRLTYGSVGDYSPADAVHYKHYTSLKGVMEKEGPAKGEFEVPAKLKELYESKDYGPYAEEDYMPVCFTSNNDITGGNSGSPVINGRGELIGLAFDGNWEAMSGDIVFEDELQKTINVDIRYVLFIIDKYAGATHLVEEMTIVE